MPYFKLGYELNHKGDEYYWDHLELLISYRTAFTLLKLAEINTCGVLNDLDKVKKFFRYIIMQDSPLDGMTAAMSLMKGE